jgi:hypothetical protein
MLRNFSNITIINIYDLLMEAFETEEANFCSFDMFGND